MLEFKGKCVIGIDLAASSKNPTGWAIQKKQNFENAFTLHMQQNHKKHIAE